MISSGLSTTGMRVGTCGSSVRIGPRNIDHTVSLLKLYIKNVKEHPWVERVIIFLDIATSTNKNRSLFGWAMEEVKCGLVQSIHYCFLAAGHTKIAPDRLFASCSQSYNTADVFNTKELKGIYAKHCRTVAICKEAHIHPWRSIDAQRNRTGNANQKSIYIPYLLYHSRVVQLS